MAEKEYIERDALIEEIGSLSVTLCGNELFGKIVKSTVKRTINEQPTADVALVVHGEWHKDGDWLVCLNCESEINVKNSLGVENKKNYCPNCGAKMDGGEKNKSMACQTKG